jgi:hypothetical protein
LTASEVEPEVTLDDLYNMRIEKISSKRYLRGGDSNGFDFTNRTCFNEGK